MAYSGNVNRQINQAASDIFEAIKDLPSAQSDIVTNFFTNLEKYAQRPDAPPTGPQLVADYTKLLDSLPNNDARKAAAFITFNVFLSQDASITQDTLDDLSKVTSDKTGLRNPMDGRVIVLSEKYLRTIADDPDKATAYLKQFPFTVTFKADEQTPYIQEQAAKIRFTSDDFNKIIRAESGEILPSFSRDMFEKMGTIPGLQESYVRNKPLEYYEHKQAAEEISPGIGNHITAEDMKRPEDVTPTTWSMAIDRAAASFIDRPFAGQVILDSLNVHYRYTARLQSLPHTHREVFESWPEKVQIMDKIIDGNGITAEMIEHRSEMAPWIQTKITDHLKANPGDGASYLANYPETSHFSYVANIVRDNIDAGMRSDTSPGMEVVRAINELHEAPADKRFFIVSKMSASSLYDLISMQAQDHYTSTYNGLMDRLISKMDNEHTSLSEILGQSEDRKTYLGDFLNAASTYKRLKDFLEHTTPQEQTLLVDTLFSQINNEFGASAIFTAGSFLKGLPADSPLIPSIEEKIIANFNGAEDPYVKDQFGLLASWYGEKLGGHTPTAKNAEFFKRITSDPNYHLPDLRHQQVRPTAQNPDALLDSKGRNFQMHVFYNDEDGKNSYASMRASLQHDKWSEEKKGNFIVFSKSRNGRHIEMLISPPESDGAAVSDIREYVEKQDGKISVLMHRGHSYHVDNTLQEITPDNKIVNLGSCGGANNIDTVLQSSPNAHILSTAGTGRMVINNHDLVWINRQILTQDTIDWSKLSDYWEKMSNSSRLSAEMREDFSRYIAPHKNYIALFDTKLSQMEIERLDAEDTAEAKKAAEQPEQDVQPTRNRAEPSTPPSPPTQNSYDNLMDMLGGNIDSIISVDRNTALAARESAQPPAAPAATPFQETANSLTNAPEKPPQIASNSLPAATLDV